VRAVLRTVAMFGGLFLAIWLSYRVDEWWLALLLIGGIFAVSAMVVMRPRP